VPLTFTDVFCGAGGSSTGLVEAGFELTLAANHWPRAIETHALNHPSAEHLCADVNNYDMRRLPSTDVAWFSPICTEATPAGAGSGTRTRRTDGQLTIEAFGHVEQAGFERTRATFHDVIRATEVHRYKAVIVENVPDVAWRWELIDWWCQGMIRLGYRMRIVSASSAHLAGPGNEPAPQWRDRAYFVFVRDGIPAIARGTGSRRPVMFGDKVLWFGAGTLASGVIGALVATATGAMWVLTLSLAGSVAVLVGGGAINHAERKAGERA
jgi:DNA (cytosine-5)-methyltransferase 1